MSEYLLYGQKMISNDNTIKDFSESIFNNIPVEDLKGLNSEEYFYVLVEKVLEAIENDISRTDIDYEKLMYKYREEIGDLLYQIENNGFDLGDYPVYFFGERAEDSFN